MFVHKKLRFVAFCFFLLRYRKYSDGFSASSLAKLLYGSSMFKSDVSAFLLLAGGLRFSRSTVKRFLLNYVLMPPYTVFFC